MRRRTPIAARTLLTSSLTVILTLISVLVLFSVLDHRNRHRILAERSQVEMSSVQLVINDSYTLGDLIGLRKYLDTFSVLNSWESGSLVDSLGAEIWHLAPRSLPGTNRSLLRSDIRTATGGSIGRLTILKNQTSDMEKWDQQRKLSIWGLAGIAVMVLIIQSVTLFRVLRPISALSEEIQREARQLNLQLTTEKGEDELFRIKRWFAEVALSWQKEKARAARESHLKAMGILAAQVSHDIRSPLASLLSTVQLAQELDETSRIQIRTAVNRIRDIANNLLAQERRPSRPLVTSEPRSLELLSTLVESTLSQKRLQFQGRPEIVIEFEVEPSAHNAFSEIHPTEFHRIISNLINNSIEAFDSGGRVDVNLRVNGARATLAIRDNGRGIPADVLPKVTERGGTFGKPDGHGLGLSHAKVTLDSWGGALQIASELGQGTTVELQLPLADPPSWFASELLLTPSASVIILDDDPGIHHLWESRFARITPTPRLLSFRTSEELLTWYRESLGGAPGSLYLCDYELLGSQYNGLEVIERLGIERQAVLVTSRAEEPTIRMRCLRRGLRLLPKSSAAWVPIGTGSTPGAAMPR